MLDFSFRIWGLVARYNLQKSPTPLISVERNRHRAVHRKKRWISIEYGAAGGFDPSFLEIARMIRFKKIMKLFSFRGGYVTYWC